MLFNIVAILASSFLYLVRGLPHTLAPLDWKSSSYQAGEGSEFNYNSFSSSHYLGDFLPLSLGAGIYSF